MTAIQRYAHEHPFPDEAQDRAFIESLTRHVTVEDIDSIAASIRGGPQGAPIPADMESPLLQNNGAVTEDDIAALVCPAHDELAGKRVS